MERIDIEKFIRSLFETVKLNDNEIKSIQKCLNEQGFAYVNGEIVEYKDDTELKEQDKMTEDEKMVKSLITFFQRFPYDSIENAGTNAKEALAWLEKQEAKNSDVRYKCFEKLIAADDAYQMSMNDEMVQNAKRMAMDALSKLPIYDLLDIKKKDVCEGCNNIKGCVTCVDGDQWAQYKYDNNKNEEIVDVVQVTNKFKAGDYCIDKTDGTTFIITKVLDNVYYYTDMSGNTYASAHYYLEENARLWNIFDAKDGDVLEFDCGFGIFKKLSEDEFNAYCHCYLDRQGVFEIDNNWMYDTYQVRPAIKEQRELLFTKIKEAGYVWDDQNKELKRHIIPKFKVGDWIIYTGENRMKAIRQITKITDTSYVLDNVDANIFYIEDIENVYRLWSIEDAVDGDILASNGLVFIYKSHNEYGIVQSYCSYGENTGFTQNYNKTANINNVYPATPEQYETLFAKIREYGYMWDSDNKKLRKIVRNPRFKAGDWISSGTGSYFKVLSVENEYNGIKDYILLEPSGNETSYNVEFVDNTFDSWSIDNAEEGDILVSTNGNTIILYKGHSQHTDIILSHCYLDNRYDEFGVKFESWYSKVFYPATEEQRKLFFKKMCEAGYEWDVNNRKFITVGSDNDKWTKDDEKNLIYSCYQLNDELSDWVKSLKERINRKWTEEDDENFTYCSAQLTNSAKEWLKSLVEKIKNKCE